MKAIDRFYEYLAEKSLKPTAIEKEIGLSNGYLSAQKKRGADMGEGMMLKVIDYFRDINPLWLLTGEGPMLRDRKNPEESKLGGTPIATPISPAEESIIYKMYKDEKEEKERLVKEKETKIDQLQSELRQKSEELAALKALHPQSQDKEPDPHSRMNEALETFTDKPSGDYGEGYSPMKKPTTSKRSSAGKI